MRYLCSTRQLLHVVFFVIGFNSLGFAQATNIPPLQPYNAQALAKTWFDWSSLAFDGMSAIGTFAVALLAVFGPRIRNWFIRPKLTLAVGKESPFVECTKVKDESASSATRVSYSVRLQIVNSGKEAARNCKLLCDCIYKQRDQGSSFYLLKRFVPKEFYWTGGNQREDVVPKLPSYINVASITEPIESASASGEGETSRLKFALHILVEAEGSTGRFYCAGTGRIVCPVITYSDNLPTSSKLYLEMLWTGKSDSEFDDAHFQVRLLSEDEGNKLVGGVS